MLFTPFWSSIALQKVRYSYTLIYIFYILSSSQFYPGVALCNKNKLLPASLSLSGQTIISPTASGHFLRANSLFALNTCINYSVCKHVLYCCLWRNFHSCVEGISKNPCHSLTWFIHILPDRLLLEKYASSSAIYQEKKNNVYRKRTISREI